VYKALEMSKTVLSLPGEAQLWMFLLLVGVGMACSEAMAIENHLLTCVIR
jgi:hypothetical protein